MISVFVVWGHRPGLQVVAIGHGCNRVGAGAIVDDHRLQECRARLEGDDAGDTW